MKKIKSGKKALIIALLFAFSLTAMPFTSSAASLSDYDLTVKPIKPVLRIKPALSVKPAFKIMPQTQLQQVYQIADPIVIPAHVKYSGDYAVEYDLTNIEITIAGGTSTVSLDEVRSGGAMVGSIELPAEVADQVEEMLASQVNVQIEARRFGPFHKITLQGDREGDQTVSGLVNRKTKRFTIARLNAVPSAEGQCAAIGGVVTTGTFDKQDGNPVMDGSSSVGLLIGCEGLLVGAKATINWTATQIQ